jgi:methylase of polypeptide subunit release factors
MHPLTAARLVEAFCPVAGQLGAKPEPGAVLDPFCGSGTVLVEAMLAGRRAVGTDLSPLAVRLARLKTRVRAQAELRAIAARAREAAAAADARRKARAGATRRYGDEDVALFEPHVLLELDGLRAGIAALPAGSAREALEMVLSAILVKVSRRRGDTSEGAGEARRIAAGYPARLFVKKADELCARLAAFAARVPKGTPDARVEIDDATRLESVAPASVDAIVTSPPYVATYDYLAHHAARMRWLGLDARTFEAGEIGARRRYTSASPRDAHAAWSREVEGFLRAAARVLRPNAVAALLVADSAVRGAALRAEEIFAAAAARAGLAVLARASQERPHFHGPTLAAFQDRPRREHALLLGRK